MSDDSQRLELFAGIPVSDLAAAKKWWGRLLGTGPSFLPNDSEAVWELAEHRFVYIVVDAERAGGGLVTGIVDDLEERIEAIAGRGIEPTTDETYSNGVRKLTYHDPDGNEIGLGRAPAED